MGIVQCIHSSVPQEVNDIIDILSAGRGIFNNRRHSADWLHFHVLCSNALHAMGYIDYTAADKDLLHHSLNRVLTTLQTALMQQTEMEHSM